MGAVRLSALVAASLERRRALVASLPQTDCYRLLHGAVEGWPGLTVDRYGPLLLVQTFRDPLSPVQQAELLTAVADLDLLPVFRHRGREPAEVPALSPARQRTVRTQSFRALPNCPYKSSDRRREHLRRIMLNA